MLRSLETTDVSHVATIWNAACGPDLAITPRFAAYNLRPATGAVQCGWLATQDDQPVGFVMASAMHGVPDTSAPYGWIDALAVSPAFQRHGLGGELLAWAEAWLAEQGCTHARLGGSLHPFAPGLPVELNTESFFHRQGYHGRAADDAEWDVARDLSDYAPRSPNSTAQVRQAQPGDQEAILSFLAREFPGRWLYEFQGFMREGGRLSDYALLWTERGVDGFARLTFEDSERPIERFYMHRLPHPWGQLGPIGVSGDCRGKGYGGALLDGGLGYLRDHGVRGCVIDWTDLVDFYAKFGFQPYRQYVMLLKSLDEGQRTEDES